MEEDAAIDGGVAGGGGNDTLIGPPTDSFTTLASITGLTPVEWIVDGAGSGHVAGVGFSGMENLTGAADNEDTFVFEQEGSISGLIEGGDLGFDSLDVKGFYNTILFTPTGPDSGFVDRDGNVIEYAGLEPVNAGNAAEVVFNGTAGIDNWIVEDSLVAGKIQVSSTTGAIETTSFFAPEKLTINLGAGNDTISIHSFGDSGFGDLGVSEILEINGDAGDDIITITSVDPDITYTIDGGNTVETNGDKIEVTASGSESFSLSGTQVGVGSETLNITEIEKAEFTAGEFSSLSISSWTGNDPVLNNNTITGDMPGSNIANIASTILTTLTGSLDDLLAAINAAQDAGGDFAALANSLPFVEQLVDGSGVADLAGLTEAFEEIVTKAKNKLLELDPVNNAADRTVDAVLAKLNGPLGLTTPDPLDSLSLSVDASYRVPDGGTDPLELLFNFHLSATANTTQTFDLAETGAALGVDLDVVLILM